MQHVPSAPDIRPPWQQRVAGPWTAFRRLPAWGQAIGWLVGFWILPALWLMARATSPQGVAAGVLVGVLGLASLTGAMGGGDGQDGQAAGLESEPSPTPVSESPTPDGGVSTSPSPAPSPSATPDPLPPSPTPSPAPSASSPAPAAPAPSVPTTPSMSASDDRAAGPSVPDDGETTTVERIVDGDTLYLAGLPERARLIGINTPETVAPGRPVECYGPEASAHLAELVPPGTEVVVTRDVELVDRYDRPLVYLHRASDGLFVNEAMLADGFAQLVTYPPNVRHVDTFREAQRVAREAAAGLWGSACAGGDAGGGDAGGDPPADTGGSSGGGGSVVIARVEYVGPGRDVEFNTSEHVVLRNDGDTAVDVGGWSLTDEVGHRLVIPGGYTIPPGGELRVHTGPGDPNDDAHHAGMGQAIWNNSGGDTATLRDAGGTVVDEYSYSS